MSYTRTNLSNDVASIVSSSFDSTKFGYIANQAVRDVNADVDLRSTLKRSALSPNLFDEIYQYTLPTDLKADKIVDIQAQINRGRNQYFGLTSMEEFDRYKAVNDGYYRVAIDRRGGTDKLLISMAVNDEDDFVIDSLDAVGTWAGFGDGENLTADSDNYVKGSASINWDINSNGGTTAGIYNSSLTSFDISNYLADGNVFVWAYIPDTTNVTNFILRLGSSASAYYYITVTTTNEGTSFETGWNLLRFAMSSATETGSVTDTAIDYCALYMTKDASKTDETDYRFDQIQMKKGLYYYVRYYSRYGWQNSSGTWLENATADTDVLNAGPDEYELIKLKTAELMEYHLNELNTAQLFSQMYEKKRSEYIKNNPSQTMLLTTRYWDL